MRCLKCLGLLAQTPNASGEPMMPHYGLHEACFFSWFTLDRRLHFDTLIPRSGQDSTRDIRASSQNDSFFHGRFKKYSAQLGEASYILKMREKEVAPELPEVEYLCNQIGKSLDLPLAEFYMIDFEGDRVFVTKNFIPSNMPANLHHIYHFLSPEENYNCENLIRIVTEQTKRPYDLSILIQILLFDALIGNHDRHGRNLAFMNSLGNTFLAPVYDNVSYLALEQGSMLKANFNPTGKISTARSNEPSMKDYVKELNQLGQQEFVKQFHEKIHLSHIESLIKNSFCSELMKEAMIRLVTKRYQELKDELEASA